MLIEPEAGLYVQCGDRESQWHDPSVIIRRADEYAGSRHDSMSTKYSIPFIIFRAVTGTANFKIVRTYLRRCAGTRSLSWMPILQVVFSYYVASPSQLSDRTTDGLQLNV